MNIKWRLSYLNANKEFFPYKDSLVNNVYRDSLGDEVNAIAKRKEINGLGIIIILSFLQ